MSTAEGKQGLGAIPTSDRILWAIAAAALCYTYWPGLVGLEERWSTDARYSHGYLVPLFSLFLLWYRRDMVDVSRFRQSWIGLGPLLFGGCLRVAGGAFFLGWFDDLSMIFVITGLVLLSGGWAMLRWAWPSILFLGFMIPLPYRLEWALGYPLQVIATKASTYALETMGLPAVAEGFTITMDDVRIGVVEACNGLGMLVMFFAYATAAVFLIRRPLIDKIVIMLSAVPIALGANIARITLTGLMHATLSKETAEHFYHDLAGWLMMPMALMAFWLELKLLDWLFVEVEPVAVDATFAMVGGAKAKRTNRPENLD